MTQPNHLRRIRLWLAAFILGLVLSGITALPLETELRWLLSILQSDWWRPVSEFTGLLPWIERVHHALRTTNAKYPFLGYGTDWLAFAHLVIAVAFIGPYIDPVRNKWVITFGLIAYAGVIPLALIAGAIRGIPFPCASSTAASESSDVFHSSSALIPSESSNERKDDETNSQLRGPNAIATYPPHRPVDNADRRYNPRRPCGRRLCKQLHTFQEFSHRFHDRNRKLITAFPR